MIDRMNRLTVLPNSLAIWAFGQMGFALQAPEGVLYIDLCLGEIVGAERAFPPPVPPDAITNARLYCVTHEHIDHLHEETVRGVAKASPQVQFLTTGWCIDGLRAAGVAAERIHTPPALTPTLLLDSLRVTAIPSAHFSRETDPVKGERWLGFLFEWNGVTVYHAGDTIIYDGYIETLRRLPRADVAILPVNGRDEYRTKRDLIGNLYPAEAAQLALDLGWDLVIAGHNDLYPVNTIPMGQITEGFARYAPRQKVHIMQPGELYYYVKS